MLKMAIMGAGSIANKMADTITKMNDVKAYAIAARDTERAAAFAKKYGFTKFYGSYEEMLKDPEVQLVYIATPHSHHYKCAKMCLEAGKHVLCEKAFTVNAEQAKEILKLAEEKKLLLTEAIWTRYMPSRNMINKLIADGTIGEVTSLTANLGYELSEVKRIWDPQLAGGALLDVGVYLVNFASMIFGEDLEHVQSEAVFKNGVDMIDNINMTLPAEKQHPCSAMFMRYRTVRVRSSEQKVILRLQISIIRKKSKYSTTSMKKCCHALRRNRSQDMNTKWKHAAKQLKREDWNVRRCLTEKQYV